jgi:hypothetical protein
MRNFSLPQTKQIKIQGRQPELSLVPLSTHALLQKGLNPKIWIEIQFYEFYWFKTLLP